MSQRRVSEAKSHHIFHAKLPLGEYCIGVLRHASKGTDEPIYFVARRPRGLGDLVQAR